MQGRVVTVAAVTSVIALGAVVGFIGVLQATALIRLGWLHVSVGAVIVGAANLVFGLFARWGLRIREAAALPALGWFLALIVAVFAPHPGGDLLVPGSGWDVGAFMAAGAAGAVLAAVFASPGARPAR